MSSEVTAVAPNGAVGLGFKEETLRAAVEQGADFIGCDAGSTDAGPDYLGSGRPKASAKAYKRDLRLMLHAALDHSIPLLIGSAGYSGGAPHLAWSLEILKEIAHEDGLHFPLATIDTEQDKETLQKALSAGRIKGLGGAAPLTSERIGNAARIVAQMGPESFEEALRHGAQVVMAGRATDTSIFAAVPRMRGLSGGPTWHMAKVLECGASCVAQRPYSDSMLARITETDFVVTPPNPIMRCTPQSVAAHTLYENSDPFRLIEPGVILDVENARYTAEPDGRSVRVSGSRLLPKEHYDVRLEGAEAVGYRSFAIGGVRDPLVLARLDSFLDGAVAVIRSKVKESLDLDETEFTIALRVYGRNGCLSSLEPTPTVEGHEVGVLIEIIGQTQELAHSICSIAWHTMLHHPIPEWDGLVSNLSLPFSPPQADTGIVYEFTMNHVLRLDDPLEVGRISYMNI